MAAGGSSRLGQPKQLVEVDGIPLVRRAALAAVEAGAERAIVVLGAESEKIQRVLDGLAGVESCTNPNWKDGLSSSLKLGVAQADTDQVEGLLITLADQPYLSASDLKKLIDAFDSHHRLIAASYEGVIGVPAVFGREFFGELLELTGDAGAGQWLRARRQQVTSIPLRKAAFDVDTDGDLEKL